MRTLIYYELFKTYSKWRTYIGFIAVAILIPVIMGLMKLEGGKFIQYQLRTLQNDFFITDNLFNGWAIVQIIMNGLWVHVPVLISLVAGDQLAGEATGGTFRLILIRPTSRTAILNAKYVATLLYTVSMVLFIALLSISFGLILFGSGDLLAIDREMLTIVPEAQVLIRFVFAYLLAIWSMWVVASLAFLISSFVENSIGPIITTMTIIVIFLIISNLPIESVEVIKPYLFTTYSNVWQQAFKEPIEYTTIFRSCGILGLHSVCFWLLTLIIFKKRDILS